MNKTKTKFNAIKLRFPDAKFSISCFDTIEEIENKVLNDTDKYILYTDIYEIIHLNKKNSYLDEEYQDYFIIKKRNDKDAIYYCDVIDVLIQNNFTRDGDHKYLENIKLVSKERNNNSVKIYSSFWGS